MEKRNEEKLDNLLVEKIKEEISMEEQEMRRRKLKEQERFREMMAENEENQQKIRAEAERERIEVTVLLFRILDPKRSMRACRTSWRRRGKRRRRNANKRLST